MLLNLSITIFESFACVSPVVATSLGGILGQIEDKITKFLTPLSDA
jgi:hypothetical protein